MNAPSPVTTEARLARAEKAITDLIRAADGLKRDGDNRGINLSPEHVQAVREAAETMGIELPSAQ